MAIGSEPVKVTMVGPRRSGKTTLLASMHYVLEKELADVHLKLLATPETSAELQKRYNQLLTLRSVFRQPGGVVRVAEAIGVAPDLVDRQYDLKLVSPPGPPSIVYEAIADPDVAKAIKNLPVVGQQAVPLQFHDFPGEWLEEGAHIGRVKEWLRESFVTVVAIDTPALMEATGEWEQLHNIHNGPSVVADLLAESLDLRTGPPLVLFVPIKCERYVRDEADKARLLRRVKAGYRKSFEILAAHKDRVAAVITPVQTVGSVEFARLEAESDPDAKPVPYDDYIFAYRRIEGLQGWKPQDVEQPLRYIVRFVLCLRIQELWNKAPRALRMLLDFAELPPEKIIDTPVFRLIAGGFGGDLSFAYAVVQLSKNCKTAPPFQIVQGEPLLRLQH